MEAFIKTQMTDLIDDWKYDWFIVYRISQLIEKVWLTKLRNISSIAKTAVNEMNELLVNVNEQVKIAGKLHAKKKMRLKRYKIARR